MLVISDIFIAKQFTSHPHSLARSFAVPIFSLSALIFPLSLTHFVLLHTKKADSHRQWINKKELGKYIKLCCWLCCVYILWTLPGVWNGIKINIFHVKQWNEKRRRQRMNEAFVSLKIYIKKSKPLMLILF